MNLLEHFSLSAYNLKIGDKEAACLCLPMKMARIVKLNLHQTEITDKTLELFSGVTLGSIQNLQEIEIFLASNSSYRYRSAETFY